MMYGDENNSRISPPPVDGIQSSAVDDDILDDLFEEDSAHSSSSVSVPDVFDTGLYEEYAVPENSWRGSEARDAGRRYREQVEQFNTVDQTVNLHSPGTYDPEERQSNMLTRLTGFAFGNQAGQAEVDDDSSTLFNKIAGLDMEDVFLGEASMRRGPNASAHRRAGANLSSAHHADIDMKKRFRRETPIWDTFMEYCYFLGLFVLVFLGIFLVLNMATPLFDHIFQGFSKATRNAVHHTHAPTPSPTPPPRTSQDGNVRVHINPPDATIRIEAIKHAILEAGLTSATDLNQLDSIPFYALRWLSDTDNAILSPGHDHLLARYALAVFFYSARPDIAKAHSNGEWWLFNQNHKMWANWMAGGTICEWMGVHCSNDKIIHLNMTNSGIQGKIPSELQALSDLIVLDLSSNQIAGTIPDLVTKRGTGMSKLRNLNLAQNAITGSIPTSLNQFQNLITLHLDDNNLMGKIPPNLQNLSHLLVLDLSKNSLTGPVPASLDSMTSLKELRLQQNHLTGILPSMDHMVHLEVVNLGSNFFRGSLPVDWADNWEKLEELTLSHNSISGTIPMSYGSFAHLQFLNLNGNDIGGTLPTEMGQLHRLKGLLLDTNQISGPLPIQLGSLQHLTFLFAQHNQFTGIVDEHICKLKDKSLQSMATDCSTGSITCECCDACY